MAYVHKTIAAELLVVWMSLSFGIFVVNADYNRQGVKTLDHLLLC